MFSDNGFFEGQLSNRDYISLHSNADESISYFYDSLRDHPFKTSANFHDFWPLPPYHRHSDKILMKGIFDPYVLWPFGQRPMGTPLPPIRHADFLNGWSLNGISLVIGMYWAFRVNIFLIIIHNIDSWSSYILTRPQNFANSSPNLWLALHMTKVRWRLE